MSTHTYVVMTYVLVMIISLLVARILWILTGIRDAFNYYLLKFEQVDFDIRDIHKAVNAKRSANRDHRGW